MAKTSGCPGRLQSGLTATRPARSVSAPVLSASIFASGEACTPAAQIRLRHRMVSMPFGPLTVMDSWSMSMARVFSLISTPIFSSCSWVYFCSFGLNGGSTDGAPSSMMIRASRVLIERKSFGSTLCASSANWPASSTPVGPAPITTKVSHSARSFGSVAISAISYFDRMPSRMYLASSMVFMPGANSANSSLPK